MSILSFRVICVLSFIGGLIVFGCHPSSNNNKNAENKVDDSFFRIGIKQTNGAYYNLGEAEKMTAAVLVFLNPECPICQSYAPTLDSLFEKFRGNAVMFYGVFSGKNYSDVQIKKYISDYKIPFITLSDPDMKLVKALNAKITPEVFVIYKSNNIAYHGNIDNSNYALGKHRTVVTEHYLNDVLDDIIHHQFTSAKNNEAVGCIIE